MTKNNSLFFLILFAFVLTGCETRKGPPAPVSYGPSLPSSAPTSPSPKSELLFPEPVKAQKIIVENHETLAMVAKKTGIPAHQLIILNNLKRPYLLQPGQELRLTEDIPLKESVLPEDQSLTESTLEDPHDDSTSTPQILPMTKPKRKLTEAEQELITSLQQEKQSMSQKEDDLTALTSSLKPNREKAAKQQSLSDKKTLPSEDTPSEMTSLPAPHIEETPSLQEEDLPLTPKKPSLKTSQFAWPVKGKVISRFGPGQGTLQNDGINIAAPEGSPILAIEDGLVVYAGNEMQAFGNLILLKHPSGWISSYGHAAKLLVERGAQVQKGQTIALVGHTGSVDKPQLHFELRDLTKNGKVVNPELYLE